jgi:hypothetical protein
MAQNRIVNGYPDGTFLPNNTMTRAEAVTVLSLSAGRSDTPLGNVDFIDVPPTHWAYRRIMNASIPRP